MDRKASLPPHPTASTSYKLPPVAHLCATLQSPTDVQQQDPTQPPRPKRELTPKEMRSRLLQAERKRQWRQNQTPEQKERRKRIDANRKRRERGRLTEEQRAENRRKDAARKAAKRHKENQEASTHALRANHHHRLGKFALPPGSAQDATRASAALHRTTSLGRLGETRSDFHSYRHSQKQHAPTSIQSLLN